MPLLHQSNMPQTSVETHPNYLFDLIILYTGGYKPRLRPSVCKKHSQQHMDYMNRRPVFPNYYTR